MSLRRPIWASQRFPGGSGLWRGGLWTSQRALLDELRALINDLFGDGQQGLLFVPEPVVLDEQRLYKLSDFTGPVTADNDPVGAGEEVSGNGNHVTQPTSADRPTYNTDGAVHWVAFDGVGDHLVLDAVEAAVTTTVSVFIAHRRADISKTILLTGDALDDFCFIAGSGNTSGSLVQINGVAKPGVITRVDGTDVTTRDALHLATSDLGWHIWELEGLPLAEMGALRYGGYGGAGWELNGDGGGIIIVEESSPVDRTLARNYLADLVGITL